MLKPIYLRLKLVVHRITVIKFRLNGGDSTVLTMKVGLRADVAKFTNMLV